MKSGKRSSELIPIERIQNTILIIRGQKVMLDSDLAGLYQVELKRLNEQVKRNIDRFPPDFVFQLTKDEFENLRFQFGTSNLKSQFATSSSWGGKRKLPYAFTEHGAIMLASVLNSPRAVEASVFVVRAFVRLREFILSHGELARKLAELERKVAGHDSDIQTLVAAIRQLMAPPSRPRREIGFRRK